MTINFRLDKRGLKAEKLIYLVVTYKGKQKLFSTPYSIPADKWDDKNQKAKGTYTHHLILNGELSNIKNFVEQKQIELTSNGKIFDINKLYSEINRYFNKKGTDVAAILNLYFEYKKSRIEAKSIITFKQAFKILDTFQSLSKLQIEEINRDFIEKFITYLKEGYNFKGKNKKSITDTTIKIYISIIKGFCKWAYTADHTTVRHYDKWDTSNLADSENENIALFPSEIEKIWDLKLTDRLEKTRDMFILALFAGQRVGDVINLKREEITLQNGFWFWTNTQDKGRKIKVKTKVVVRLNDITMGILQKYDYNFNPENLTNENVTAKINDDLKKIVELADLKRTTETISIDGIKTTVSEELHITSHVARHTFTTLMDNNGIAYKTYTTVTGHKVKMIGAVTTYIHPDHQKNATICNDKLLELINFKKAI